MTRLLFAFVLVLAAGLLAWDAGAGRPSGTYAVGLHVRPRDAARPMQVLVWYPAAGRGRALAYRDYVATIATEEAAGLDPARARRITDAVIADRAGGPGGARVRRAMGRTMLAQRDAPELDGRFPVVIHAPGRAGPAMEYADLCESLARRGYIVLAGRSPDGRAADVAFLLAQARALPQADTARIAVVGFDGDEPPAAAAPRRLASAR